MVSLEKYKRSHEDNIKLLENQWEKIKYLENQIKALNKENNDLHNKLQSHSQVLYEKSNYESALIENKQEIEVAYQTIKRLEEIVSDKSFLIESLEESLLKHESENAELAMKLTELKNAVNN